MFLKSYPPRRCEENRIHWRKLMPLKDRYQSEHWKEYQRNYQRGWYQRHKTKRLAMIYERKAAIYKYIHDIKNQLCCADCGERHPATLHFHQLNSEDKAVNIRDAVYKGFSLGTNKRQEEKG